MKLLHEFMTSGGMFRGGGNRGPWLARPVLAGIVSLGLILGACPDEVAAFQDQSNAPGPQDSGAAPAGQAPARAAQTPEQLQQLVAPIALYPDSLVAQVLAASTFPEQVVEADRWVQAHPELKGDDLASAVDQMSWDPSVKALTAFPNVLANMDKNISWTSSLGDAYYNQEQDVMDAVQVMRQKAEQAGNLKSTPQQTVTTQGSTVVIEPASPQIVYVPAYNPWLVYGYPVTVWPGWYPVPGIWYGGPFISFGFGYPIGWFGGYGWGWNRWGFDWGRRVVVYNHNRYYSRSTTFYNRNSYYRGAREGERGRVGAPNRPFGGDTRAARGYEPGREAGREPGREPGGRANPPNRGGGKPEYRPAPERGSHTGAFGGYGNGGQARGESSRGSRSMGGGGGGGRGGRR